MKDVTSPNEIKTIEQTFSERIAEQKDSWSIEFPLWKYGRHLVITRLQDKVSIYTDGSLFIEMNYTEAEQIFGQIAAMFEKQETPDPSTT